MDKRKNKKEQRPSDQDSLMIDSPDSIHEKEAESASKMIHADQLMGMSTSPEGQISGNGEKANNTISRENIPGREESMIVPGKIKGEIESTKGNGEKLPENAKHFAKGQKENELAEVNIHTDSKAAELSQAMNAKAFTYGKDIYFGQGEYDTYTSDGKELLAHELAHTQQGQENLVQRSIIIGGTPYTPLPQEVTDYGETITKMDNGGKAPPTFSYNTHDELIRDIKMRKSVIDTALGLDTTYEFSVQFGFNPDTHNFSLPVDYWDNIGGETNKFKIKEGVKPSAAVRAIFENGKIQTWLDCNMMMVAMQYKAMLDTAKSDDDFDAMFPGGQNLYIGQHELYNDLNFEVGYPTPSTEHPFHDKQLFSQADVIFPQAEDHKDDPDYKIEDHMADNLVPGDWVYFSNFHDFKFYNRGSGWQGEHAVYTGIDPLDGKPKFAGFGVSGAQTYKEICDTLYREFREGYEAYWQEGPGKSRDMCEEQLKTHQRDEIPGIEAVYRSNTTNISNLPK